MATVSGSARDPGTVTAQLSPRDFAAFRDAVGSSARERIALGSTEVCECDDVADDTIRVVSAIDGHFVALASFSPGGTVPRITDVCGESIPVPTQRIDYEGARRPPSTRDTINAAPAGARKKRNERKSSGAFSAPLQDDQGQDQG